MARQPLRIVRGTAAQVAAYTGGPAEPVYNVETKTLHVQDGVTPGGNPLLPANGDGSAVKVQSVLIGAVPRAQSARAVDRPTVKDFGAVGNGVDQTAAIKAAQAAVGPGILRWPSGSYRTDGSVPYDGLSTAFDMDAPTIAGGYLNGVQNLDATNSSVRVRTVPWGNRFGHSYFYSGVNPPSNSPGDYERTTHLFHYEQRDPSVYGSSQALRDLVGTDWQGEINSNCQTGRIWGTSFTLNVRAGSDGYVLGHEGGIVNEGSAQPLTAQPNTKVGIQMVAGGSQPSTAAYTAIGNQKWFHGYYADATAIAYNAFLLKNGANGADLAYISGKGEILGQRLTIAGGDRVQGSGVAFRQTREVVLRATSTGGAAVRLTADGGPANATNVVNIADFVSASVSIRLVARNASTGGQDVAWLMPLGILHRASGAASTGWVASSTPQTLNYGTGIDFTVGSSADTVNGGLNLAFAPASGNTDQWSVTATVTTTETT